MHTATRSQTIQERADAIALNPIYSPSGQVWLTLVEVVKATNMKQTCLCWNCLIPEFKKDSNQTKNNSYPATRNMKRHTSHLQQKPQCWAWTIVTDLGNSSLNKTQRLFSRFCVGTLSHLSVCCGPSTKLWWQSNIRANTVWICQFSPGHKYTGITQIHTFPPINQKHVHEEEIFIQMKKPQRNSKARQSDEWWRTLTPQRFSVYTSPL